MGTFKMASMRLFGAVREFSTTAARSGKLAPTPIQVFGTSGRYATAIYSAATKEKKLDVVEKELKGVQALLAKDPKLNEFVLNPTIKRTLKSETMQSTLKKQNMSNLTINLFAALAENGRLGASASVIDTFNKLMAAHRGEVICSVTTAKPLEAALKSFLGKGESLLMETKVDPGLIGGMVVTIGDKYVDMSMSSKIKTYTNLIKQAV